CHGMQTVRDVAEQDQMGPDLLLGNTQAERMQRALPDAPETAEALTEVFLQGSEKTRIVECQHLVCRCTWMRPDQCCTMLTVVIGQRQQGQRSLGRETFEGQALVRLAET